MTRRDATLLLLLSAIWGSSFLFIKLGVDELEPAVVVFGRTLVGVVVLLPLLLGRGGLAPLRGSLGPLAVLAGRRAPFSSRTSSPRSRSSTARLLDEPVTTVAVAGLALVLAGTALATGLVRGRRRATVRAG